MILCDVSCCERPAVVLVKFKHQDRSWPYCGLHGLRRGTARDRFGCWTNPWARTGWVTWVRHEQQISTQQRGTQ